MPLNDKQLSLLKKGAELFGVPFKEARALAWAESHDGALLNNKIAKGILQVKPSTMKEMGFGNPDDEEHQILSGLKYYSNMRKQFKDVGLATTAYNAGPNQLSKWINKFGGIKTKEDKDRFLESIPWKEPKKHREKFLQRYYELDKAEQPIDLYNILANMSNG